MNTIPLYSSVIRLIWTSLFLLFFSLYLLFTYVINHDCSLHTSDTSVMLNQKTSPTDENNILATLSEEEKKKISIGKTLFKNNCASCHAKNMTMDLTGPALSGVSERWAAYPKEDLYSWIRNSQQLINNDHPRAVEVWKEWSKVPMPALDLEDKEIESILMYIKSV